MTSLDASAFGADSSGNNLDYGKEKCSAFYLEVRRGECNIV